MTWDAMIRDEELHRRRALARFTKVQLIDLIVEAEHREHAAMLSTTNHEIRRQER